MLFRKLVNKPFGHFKIINNSKKLKDAPSSSIKLEAFNQAKVLIK